MVFAFHHCHQRCGLVGNLAIKICLNPLDPKGFMPEDLIFGSKQHIYLGMCFKGWVIIGLKHTWEGVCFEGQTDNKYKIIAFSKDHIFHLPLHDSIVTFILLVFKLSYQMYIPCINISIFRIVLFHQVICLYLSTVYLGILLSALRTHIQWNFCFKTTTMKRWPSMKD